MLGPVIEEVAAEVDDVKICKVDVDQCMDLARQYKVVSIPMLVVFENGEVTGKQLGPTSKEEVLHLIGKKRKRVYKWTRTGIVMEDFRCFTLKHMEHILAAKMRCDKLYIGITNPDGASHAGYGA